MGDKLKKLSDAIRLGATFRPQCRECYFHHDGNQVTSSCAIGAAIEALTGETEVSSGLIEEVIEERFGVDTDIEHEIVTMNDKHGMTREAIADWLEAKGL